ncbi:MAG TPA: hypothetical protein VFA48_06205 [Gammaproteobacteria bacterium]|nr:hypothetical protein [Gammaproteobacteria bacterium]
MKIDTLQDSARTAGQWLFVAGFVGDMFKVMTLTGAGVAVGVGLVLIMFGCLRIAA